MSEDLLAQLGLAGPLLATIIWVVRYFIQSIDKKDSQLQKTTSDFTRIVDNHMEKAGIQSDKTMKLLDKHTEILDRHTNILDNHTSLLGVIAERIQGSRNRKN